MSRFISIYTNMYNARKFYIMKRRKDLEWEWEIERWWLGVFPCLYFALVVHFPCLYGFCSAWSCSCLPVPCNAATIEWQFCSSSHMRSSAVFCAFAKKSGVFLLPIDRAWLREAASRVSIRVFRPRLAWAKSQPIHLSYGRPGHLDGPDLRAIKRGLETNPSLAWAEMRIGVILRSFAGPLDRWNSAMFGVYGYVR